MTSSDINCIPFYTPAYVEAANYFMEINITEKEIAGTVKIEWTHTGGKPLQILQVKGNVDGEIDVPGKKFSIERDETVRLIVLDEPLQHEETVCISVSFKTGITVSPLCDGNGCVLMPQGFEGRIWHPYLAWDIVVGGNFSVDVNTQEDFQICAAGEKNGGSYILRNAVFFGLLLCRGLEHEEAFADGVSVNAYYKKGDEAAAARLLETSVDAILFFKNMTGFYPQRSYSFLPYSSKWGGGGNWSCGIAFFHGMQRMNGLGINERPWIAAHEVCHHYWGEHVRDGDHCGWLWVGLGMMMDEEYRIARGAKYTYEDRKESVIEYSRGGNSTAIWRTIEDIRKADAESNDYNSIIRHDKTFCVMQLIKHVIGKDVLFAVMKRLLAACVLRPLRTMDFWLACEQESGMSLGWLFNECIYGGGIPGYEIVSVKGREAVVKSFGGFKFPAAVEAKLKNGRTETKRLNRLMETQTIIFESDIEQAAINPDGLLIEAK